MKDFNKINKENNLQRILNGFKGALYITKDTSHQNTLLIRHFDGNISKDFIPEMVELTKEVGKWFKKYFEDQIQVVQFIEYGDDYTIRKYFLYQTSLAYIANFHNKMKTPKSLKNIRNRIQELLKVEKTQKVVKNIITKSFLQPATKSVYDMETDAYRIVEISVNENDLKEWRLAKNSISEKNIE